MNYELNKFILLACIIVLLGGCRTADLPPGFSRVGGVLQTQTSHAASSEAIFSLMTWYEEANAELNPPRTWSEAVANAKTAAQTALNEQWKAALLKVASPLLQNDLEHVVVASPKLLANRTDWNRLDAIFRNTKALLLTEHQITVPVEECQNDAFWSPKSRYGKTDFVVWAQNRRLTVPDSPQLDRQGLLAQIKTIETDIALKKNIMDSLAKAAELNKNNAQDEALALLNQVRDRVGVEPMTEINLQVILDEKIREEIWETMGRRGDQVRFGTYTEPDEDKYDGVKHAIVTSDWIYDNTGYTTVFPIPVSVLSLNSNLTQNPGY